MRIRLFANLPDFPELRFKTTLYSNELGTKKEFMRRYFVSGSAALRSIETKYDGHFARMYIGFNCGGRTDLNRLLTRRVSDVTAERTTKHQSLPKLRRAVFPAQWGQTVLEGELIHPDETLSSSDASHAIAAGFAHYRVWDVIMFNGEVLRGTMPLSGRWMLLKSMAESFIPQIKLVDTHHDPFDGLRVSTEGIVLKPRDGLGTDHWMRIIRQRLEDGVIVGFEDSTAVSYRDKGWIATVRFGQYLTSEQMKKGGYTVVKGVPGAASVREGRYLCEIGACSGFTQDKRREISENKEDFLGRVIRVKCKGRLPSLALRQPRWAGERNDKAPSKCIAW